MDLNCRISCEQQIYHLRLNSDHFSDWREETHEETNMFVPYCYHKTRKKTSPFTNDLCKTKCANGRGIEKMSFVPQIYRFTSVLNYI